MSFKVGIDQSYTSTGVCVVNSDNELIHHQIIGTSKEFGDVYQRGIYIADEIYNFIIRQKEPILMVSLEGLSFGSRGDATRNLAGLQFLIIDRIQQNWDFQIIAPQTLKKKVIKGNASKEEMFEHLPSEIYELFNQYNKSEKFDLMDSYYLATL